MKIYEGQGPIIQQTNKNRSKNGANEGDFKKIMDQISPPPGKKAVNANRESLGPVAGGIHILNGVEQVKEPLDVDKKRQVIEELRDTLDLVDFYAAKLADSSFSISGITPLISHIEDRLEALRNMEASPGMPEKLRPIISDMTITIGAEIAKFKRGDYS